MDSTDLKIISWILLLGMLIGCFFLLRGLVDKELVKSKSDEGIWVLFYIGSVIAFIASIWLMYYWTEEKEWNPFGSAFLAAIAFPIIIGLIAIVLIIAAIALIIWIIYAISKSGSTSSESKGKDYTHIGTIDIYEKNKKE